LRDLLTSPLQQSGLNFTVQAAPFKGPQKDASVALAIEIEGDRLTYAPPDAKGMSANKIELSFYGVNDVGKAMGGTHSVLDLTLRPDTKERVAKFGVRVNPRVALPPGRYHMRIGARETVGGLTGSVFYELEVPDFRKEKLMLGGLLIAAASGQETPSIQADTVIGKVLPGAATSRRVFPRRDLLAIYTEVYDNLGPQQARNVDVAVRLIDENGKELFVTRDQLTNGGPKEKAWDIYGYTTQFALKDVPPGRYALRVEAQVRGNVGDAKPVSRETLITVVP
jgi:hypothetical protein